ncbi:MAG: bifunctional methylenetetrahydrofolate dehydrogenase/methenyltetrahydrofolate cyclohydrolase FolD [Coriobacteriia bacterium]|nr:bifunctional methylenetetrahydrofolate dehydrogenase/methenyltetrahydrofolate cyclohydrolase FolD [Coriobacteriia bacterium]
MAATIIDGKAIAASRREQIAARVGELKEAMGVTPGLAVVIVGENPASQVYVRSKEKACAEVGILSEKHALPEDVSQQELLALVDELNTRNEIHGILVQLPLPEHIDEDAVIEAITPAKDVDGFHPISVGKMMIGQETFLPCTPHGCMVLLEETGIELKGKEAVVVGRSNIVGKPIAMLLLAQHATVTICHSRTRDLAEVVGRADVLVVGVGRPEMIKGDWIKPGAVVIDVGINRTDAGLVGDVEFEAAKERASAITPVPGGVGPMTIAMLMENTLLSAMRATNMD